MRVVGRKGSAGEIRMSKGCFGNCFAAGAGMLIVSGWFSACSTPKPTAPPSPPVPVLWGDMKPVVSVKELMRDMIDPIADNIFDAVKIETTRTGTVEKL